MPRILDMTPVGRFADGDPIYKFSVGFPTRGVKVTEAGFSRPDEAEACALRLLREYCAADPFGNMGSVLGVTQKDGEYHGVYVTYHSNT